MTTITCNKCGASVTSNVQEAIRWDNLHQERCRG